MTNKTKRLLKIGASLLQKSALAFIYCFYYLNLPRSLDCKSYYRLSFPSRSRRGFASGSYFLLGYALGRDWL